MMKIFVLAVTFLAWAYGQRDPSAKWMPSPHYNSRGGFRPKWLIIHGSTGGPSAEAIGSWFQNPDSQAATHYVIGQDGAIVQCVDEGQAAWGNGRVEAGADPWWKASNSTPNQVTININLVKQSTDNSDSITNAQRDASLALVQRIIARNSGIKAHYADSTGGITGSYSISPLSRERSPGPYTWEELFTFLNRSSKPICLGTVIADADDDTLALNITSQPTFTSEEVGSVPDGRVLNIQSKVSGESVSGNSYWFLLGDGSGYVSAYYVRVHIKQPVWCVG